MKTIYCAIIKALLVGLAVGISSLILESLKIENKIVLAIVFSISAYVFLTSFEKYQTRKSTSTS